MRERINKKLNILILRKSPQKTIVISFDCCAFMHIYVCICIFVDLGLHLDWDLFL